jgi:Ca2+-binding EF-hand superfamily protein
MYKYMFESLSSPLFPGFGKKKQLYRLCLEIVSYSLQNEQIDELRDAFKKIDVSGSGEISVEDMRTALAEKLPEKDIHR